MAEEYYVEIIEIKTMKVESRMGPYSSKRVAEQCKRGADINLNHAEYYVDLRKVK